MLPGAVPLEFVRIAAGKGSAGSPETDAERWPDEALHATAIPRDFLLGKYPVTQAQWQAVMGANPSQFAACGANCPVDNVSWRDCRSFVQRLNARVGCGFRLPSEAEWEWACRAGSEDVRAGVSLDDAAWYSDNASGATHPVGQKRGNAWGLHDMLGNVWQWCATRYAPEERPIGSTERGANRAMRGGSFSDNARSARCAARDSDGPDARLPIYGCRIARDL
jgi:formylglycine-generating enzyme required for sulfatase activity